LSEQRPRNQLHEEGPPTPLWVKVFGGVALAVLVVFVILLLVGSEHGPNRHFGPAAPGDSPLADAALTVLVA